MNSQIPPKLKSEQDRIDGNVFTEYEAWIVQGYIVFIWLLSTISKFVLPQVLSCKHAFEWDKNPRYFNSHMKARVKQLRIEVKYLKKGNKYANEYVLGVKSIVISLLAVEDSII